MGLILSVTNQPYLVSIAIGFAGRWYPWMLPSTALYIVLGNADDTTSMVNQLLALGVGWLAAKNWWGTIVTSI